MLYVAGALLCLNIVLWVLLYMRLDKKYSPDAFLARIQDKVDSIVLEINRVTDRNLTVLNARREELRALLLEIEEKTQGSRTPVKAPPPPPLPPTPPPTAREQATLLSRQGLSPDKIAERLGMSITEVELYTI